jgi:hypothetical protein
VALKRDPETPLDVADYTKEISAKITEVENRICRCPIYVLHSRMKRSSPQTSCSTPRTLHTFLVLSSSNGTSKDSGRNHTHRYHYLDCPELDVDVETGGVVHGKLGVAHMAPGGCEVGRERSYMIS